jgi:hypothetical protein
MEWLRTLKKTAWAAGFAAIGILLMEAQGWPVWWAPVLVAALTALRDYLRHTAPPLPTYD